VALHVPTQVAGLERRNITAASNEQVDALLLGATAMLAELQPTTATEALLAAQMIGAQHLAMTVLTSSLIEGQTVQAADAHILRATRLMRLLDEQVETMAKLKANAVSSGSSSST